MLNRMTVTQTAKLMQVSDQFVRVGLQTGRLPFGYAVKISKNRWTYFINPELFEQHTGIKIQKKTGATNTCQKG